LHVSTNGRTLHGCWRFSQDCKGLGELFFLLRRSSANFFSLQIKVKSDSLPVRYTSDGLEFADGSHLKADVIVFATGFKSNMRYLVQDIFGLEIADQMGDFWNLDKEGELKGFAKSSGRMFIPSLGEDQANSEMQIRLCGILVGRLGRRGFIRGLLHYRLRLSCWGRRWRFIRRLLDVLKLRVVLFKSHLISLTTVPSH